MIGIPYLFLIKYLLQKIEISVIIYSPQSYNYGGILPYFFKLCRTALFQPHLGKYMFTALYLYIIQYSSAYFIQNKLDSQTSILKSVWTSKELKLSGGLQMCSIKSIIIMNIEVHWFRNSSDLPTPPSFTLTPFFSHILAYAYAFHALCILPLFIVKAVVINV